MKNCIRYISKTSFVFIFITSSCFAQWIQMALPNVKVNCVTFNNYKTILFAGTNAGIYSTTNNGDSWVRKDNGVITSSVNAINLQTSNYFAGTDNGLYSSTDEGNSWQVVSATGLTDQHINAIIFDAYTNVYLGTSSGVFIAQNNTPNFLLRNTGLTNLNVLCFGIQLANMTEYLWCGTEAGLFVTTNQANSWSSKNVGSNRVNAISTNTMLFFASNAGMYAMTYSQNNPTLNAGGLNDINLLSVCITNIQQGNPNLTADLFAGTGTTGKVFYSNAWGGNWRPVTAGLNANNRVNCIIAAGPYIIIGTDNGIWRRTLSSLTNVEDTVNFLPSNYYLDQNYPNPFNPSTRIKYQLKQRNFVTIKIYDGIGNEIQTLIQKEEAPGSYEIIFDGKDLPSGIYFYRIQAGDFTQTRKMILIK